MPQSQTVAVDAYPWAGSLNPNSDYCNASTPEYLTRAMVNGVSQNWLGPFNGALYQCSYEENIAIMLAGTIRW